MGPSGHPVRANPFEERIIVNDTYPVSLDKTETQLRIVWSDGMEQVTRYRDLRDACQCATCMEKRKPDASPTPQGALPILSAADTMPLRIVAMQPAGNYAYNIQFSDGHTTGLFTLELLRSLAETDESL